MTPASDMPALADFEREVMTFLDQEADRRVSNDRATRWGEGSDSVALFRDTTAEEVEEARRWRRAMFDAGFGWITGPVEFGGRALPPSYERAYARLERQYDTPPKQSLGVSIGMVGPTLHDFGSTPAKERWLRAIFRADAVGCQLFSEPGAGSDLASVSTRAVPDGEDWVVTGQKVWTSGAHYADVGLLLARTSDGPRHRNLTAFVLDMGLPGIEVRPLRQMTGGSEFNEVFLDEVRVPDECRLGDVDAGWKVAIATLAHERGAVGGSAGGGSGILDLGRIVELIRHQGMEQDPQVRQLYARLHANVTAARFSRRRSQDKARAGERPGPEMSLSKLVLTENLQLLSALVTRVLGPRLTADTGEWGTYAWSEFVLGVPGIRLGGGTDEIQKNIVAERVLMLPKQP